MSLAIAPPTVTYLVPGVTGRKNPRGTAKVEYLGQRHPRLTAKDAGFRIEMQQFIHASRRQERAVIEQADVAIAAARADRQYLGSREHPGVENRSSSRGV